jgi:hypothetical protein
MEFVGTMRVCSCLHYNEAYFKKLGKYGYTYEFKTDRVHNFRLPYR